MHSIQQVVKGNLTESTINLDKLTFFNYVYKRYTNYSKFYSCTDIPTDVFGKKIRIKINDDGDHLGKLFMIIKLPSVLLQKKNYSNSLTDKNI